MNKIKNGTSVDMNGWKYICIKGRPRERGYAYGYLCASEFKEIQRMLKFYIPETYGKEWSELIRLIHDDFYVLTKNEYPEFFDEMQGIADGCNANGCKTDIDEIIAWNFYLSISYWLPSVDPTKKVVAKDRCSAFMAIGDYTKDGKIVVAHNSFSEYIDGQYANVVLDIQPPKGKGHRMIMQTSPCWIWSGTDFFVTSKGIIGTETTIGGFQVYEKKNNVPACYRIREAMQYGNSLDDYVDILLDGNSGDYANSWLFGDTRKNEIMRLELGLKYHSVKRTKNGYFIGFNAAYDPKIRNLECKDSGFSDIRRHQGARNVRLTELMDKYKGKLDIEAAKIIIADHYDVYLEKENAPCSRSVCAHYNLDSMEYSKQMEGDPYIPKGACDGIVCDTKMAKQMSFAGIFGSSCGLNFIAKDFFELRPQWSRFEPYVKDMPSQPWTIFPLVKSRFNKTKKNKRR